MKDLFAGKVCLVTGAGINDAFNNACCCNITKLSSIKLRYFAD
ncbi:MAG: hypothetical protein JWM44_2500 [Bacilli bacterium]|nr:hypothetical protein [Bacilli bacterium]